jgi:hypothetical protein
MALRGTPAARVLPRVEQAVAPAVGAAATGRRGVVAQLGRGRAVRAVGAATTVRDRGGPPVRSVTA